MGMTSGAPLRTRNFEPFQTSGMGLGFWFSSPPATTPISPSPSVTVDGYQRPARIWGSCDQLDVWKSKMLPSFDPVLSATCPPATNNRPSLRKVWEEQKTSVAAFGTCVNTDGFAGLHRNT